MPLEGLDEYDSDSGSSIQSCNSEAVPKTPQDDSDSNATEAESNGEPSEEQIFDGQSDDSDQHTPVQRSKRRFSPAASSADEDVGPSDSESFLSERDQLFGPKVTSADSSALAFNGSSRRHGTRIMWRHMIIKERLRELWRSLCMMQGWKSLRDTMPGQYPIFVSKR
jgi:hypothetical protein